jgi:hypothetical protein
MNGDANWDVDDTSMLVRRGGMQGTVALKGVHYGMEFNAYDGLLALS